MDPTPLLHQTEIEEKRKTEHLMEIKETKDEDQSGMLQTNKSVNQIFHEKFNDLNNGSTYSCTIPKVTVTISESNPDAYKPKLISIGPYHKNNPQLLPMEKYKLMYLQRFLRRKDGIDVESCINEMEKLKHEALKCYNDIDYGDFSVGKFSEMLLLDGCFVVEYIRECREMVPEGEGDIMHIDCVSVQVHCDLLLLENQLPFFVLAKLYEMTMNVTDKTSIFDIKFENGLMEIPYFEVYDETEAFVRNLIAYEQLSSDVNPKYVSHFASFMDSLIDSDKEVTLLRQKGIIRNRIGEDSEVANLFNKLAKGLTSPQPNEFYYKEVFRKAVLHCEKPWNRMKANLRRNYFESPWAGISTVAAIILLLLTLTQTVLSFISVLK